jgi:UDP-glucose 4-epimerase
MKVLVTGSSGFIGSRLVKALRERGDEVIGMDLPDDILTARLPDVDFVYHLAAVARVKASYADPMRTARVNVGGTARILEEYKYQDDMGVSLGVPVVVAGTLHRGESPYAVSKMGVESLCSDPYQGYYKRLVRFGNVYGGGDGVIDKWLAADTLTIYGDGSTCKDFIHVDDVVAGLLSPKEGTSNLCTGNLTSLNELAGMFGKPVKYEAAQPGDWSTEQVTPDYPVRWSVKEFLRSRA